MARPVDAEALEKKISEWLGQPGNGDYYSGYDAALCAVQDLIADTPTITPPNEWVSVEERLPDKPGHYLVCTNVNYWHGGCMDKNGASSNAGTTDGYAGTTLSVLDCFRDITGDWNRVCNAHVTHWMLLPKPPKEESNEQDMQ